MLQLTLVDWHLLQESLVGVELLSFSLLVLEFRSSKLSTLEDLWILIHLNVPLSPLLHAEELTDHLDNRVHLLLWVLLYSVEKGSHAPTVLSDLVWHSIKQAELRWHTDVPTILLHDEHWLSLVGDLHIVLLVEVLRNTNLSAVLHLKECGAWTLVKHHVSDDVCPLSSVVGNNTVVNKLPLNCILEDLKHSGLTQSFPSVIRFNDLVVEVVDSVKH